MSRARKKLLNTAARKRNRAPIDLKMIEAVRWVAFNLGLYGPLTNQLIRLARTVTTDKGELSEPERTVIAYVLMSVVPAAILIDAKHRGSTKHAAEVTREKMRLGVKRKAAILAWMGNGVDNQKRYRAIERALQRLNPKQQKARPSVAKQRSVK